MFKSICFLALFVALCAAQSNVTVNVPLPSPLEQEFASCSQRDQIQWLNQLLAVEYVSQSYFSQLNNHMDRVNSSVNTSAIGITPGHNTADVKSNVTLIVNQLNEVVSWLNATVTRYCSQLPSSEDQFECYAFTPCNYTFGNLTGWPSAAPAPTPAPTAAPSNNSGNGTAGNSTSSNSTSSNSTVVPATNSSSSSNSSFSTVVPRSLAQGMDFSDRDVQFIISLIPLISNSTVQQQLAEFAVMHGQHAAYLRSLSAGRTEFVMAPILSNSNMLHRSAIRSELLPWIANPECCGGFRGLRRV